MLRINLFFWITYKKSDSEEVFMANYLCSITGIFKSAQILLPV